ncbi:MAG: type II secretion system protein [Gammaproteobacteria bacterium]|nr:type II secretion system protein [Gammaproteobacteria bacterium]
MPNGEPMPRGFTYIGVLLAIALLGATLAATGTVWHTAQQRAREADLLFIGEQYRQAIGRYYLATEGGLKQYPQTLADLIRDPRQPSVVRHLRKLYRDPITGSNDWGLIKDSNDHIMGVYCPSKLRPIKQANFGLQYQSFEGQEHYADWQFIYKPRSRNPQPTTGVSASPTPTPTPLPLR